MFEQLLLALAGVIVLGIAAQWLAWRLALPSILLLLITGFLAGPVSRRVFGGTFIDPLLDSDLLLPVVSISVALILYETTSFIWPNRTTMDFGGWSCS